MDKERYKRLAKPPKSALKTIQAGRLKGMTDINPQWRYEAMNDEFGPCGEAWTYEIVDLWTEHGADGEVFAFAKINVLFGDQINYSMPIPGIGGSKLVSKEKDRLYNNDEAFKMAVTDALSVALKMVGVASDIYMGRFDGTKYIDEAPESSKSIGKSDYDKLTEPQKIKIDGVVEEILATYNAKGVKDAYDLWEMFKGTEPLTEEYSAARGKLPSHVRTAFGKYYNSLQPVEAVIP